MKRLEIHNEIVTMLSYLNKAQQIKLLAFVKSLVKTKKRGKRGLLKLAGSIDKKDLELMKKAIEEDCETINQNEW